MIKNIVKYMVLSLILSLILSLMTLVYYQETLIYPGMSRPGQKLKKPFEAIGNSYYKKGSTGKLWVFFGGNAAIPIDYMDHIKLIEPDDSLLIITYPGYNGDKTKLSPETTNEIIDHCIKEIKLKGYKNTYINFICYSIGCAIAINWLHKNKTQINNLVLLAPFWSLDEVIYSKYPFPSVLIKSLINHNWENKKITDINKNINITIFHGKQDKLIHYSHSVRLAKLAKLTESKLIITEHDDHNTIRNKIPEILKKINP
jgi:predicted esterase